MGEGSGAAGMVLLARADAIAELVDKGEYLGARLLLHTWRSGIDVSEVPAASLDRAQQWVDAAYAALSNSEPEPTVALNALLQIRRALTP